jgi:hypothetical protein
MRHRVRFIATRLERERTEGIWSSYRWLRRSILQDNAHLWSKITEQIHSRPSFCALGGIDLADHGYFRSKPREGDSGKFPWMNFPSPHLIYQKLRVWKWWYDSRLCRLLYAGWPNSSFPLLTLCPRSGLNKSLQIFHWICEVHFATVQCKFFLTLVNDDNNKVQGF